MTETIWVRLGILTGWPWEFLLSRLQWGVVVYDRTSTLLESALAFCFLPSYNVPHLLYSAPLSLLYPLLPRSSTYPLLATSRSMIILLSHPSTLPRLGRHNASLLYTLGTLHYPTPRSVNLYLNPVYSH
eukprot:9317048-Pyramimonas_sp.AAC.2